MTDPMLTAGVRRLAQEMRPETWEDTILVANIASILDGRGYSSVHQVPAPELEELFADNSFADCSACDVLVCDDCNTPVLS